MLYFISMRQLTDKVILTTLPHYIACYFAYQINILYGTIIFLSSSFSVIWHFFNQPRNSLFYLDYTFAFFWFLTELILASLTKNLFLVFVIILLNITVAILNEIKLVGISYDTIHSIWHLISTFKGIFVAYLLVNGNSIAT